MAEGKVYYAEHQGTGVFRFEGEFRYTIANGLERFLDELFARHAFTALIVDLSATEAIDSTGLGLLARIANFVRRRDGRPPLLFSTQPDINALLTSICLDSAFTLCERPPDSPPGTALAGGSPSDREVAQTILNAHRVLCEMNEANRLQFHDVVDAFTKELGQS